MTSQMSLTATTKQILFPIRMTAINLLKWREIRNIVIKGIMGNTSI